VIFHVRFAVLIIVSELDVLFATREDGITQEFPEKSWSKNLNFVQGRERNIAATRLKRTAYPSKIKSITLKKMIS
jgi:hypothetical protein